MLIGAHPDDGEIKAGGTCALWSKAGYRVLIVSLTNGDIGHQEMAGGPLARRRKAESEASARLIGAESLVLDNHDGELQPTLAVRKKIVKIIREFNADVVITHRPNDYHPDHRYTSQAVQDAAYMVTVPFFTADVPALRKNPVFLYFMDQFQKPNPFRADIAVAVDEAMKSKWLMLDAMESQFYEWLAWHAGQLGTVPPDRDRRLKWLQKTWEPLFRPAAKEGRTMLVKWYGKAEAAKVKFAELFEVSEYGHQPSDEDISRIFPFLPNKPKRKKA